jgi:hypothetical protein
MAMGEVKRAAGPISEGELREEVRAWVAEFRRKNGIDPVRNQVVDAIGRRRANVLRALDWLDEVEAAERARLHALPDIPDALRDQGSELVEKLWVAAADVCAPIIAELRRKLADDTRLHRDQSRQNMDLMEDVEDELDRERARAEQAEEALEAAVAENEALKRELMAAQVKLEEREAVLLLLRPQAATPEENEKPAPKARARKTRTVSEAEVPQTLDIPFDVVPGGKPADEACGTGTMPPSPE